MVARVTSMNLKAVSLLFEFSVVSWYYILHNTQLGKLELLREGLKDVGVESAFSDMLKYIRLEKKNEPLRKIFPKFSRIVLNILIPT